MNRKNLKRSLGLILSLVLVLQAALPGGVLANAPGETTVNQSDWTYSSGWYHSTDRKGELNLPLMDVHNGDVHCMNQAGAWTEYTFTGSRLKLYGEKNTDGGTAKVELFRGSETTAAYTQTISCQGSARLGFQELLDMAVDQNTYRMRITVDGPNWVVLDALKYVDISGLAQNLTVTGATGITDLGARGTYTIVHDGAATNVMETQQMSVTLNNTVDIPLGDTVTLKNGATVLASKRVFNAGNVVINYAMPATNVALTIEIDKIPVTPTEVWVEDALKKVTSDASKPSGAVTSATIEMAKNDYEGFQVVLKDVTNLNVTGINFSDLTTSGGATLSKSHLSFNFVDYKALSPVGDNVKGPVVNDGSNGNVSEGYRPEVLYPKGGGTTNLPDPLSNDTSRVITHTQPILITVYTPENTPAGTYTGTATIDTAKGDIAVPISVTVHDVTIPKVENSSYTVYNWASELGYSYQHTLDSPKIFYGLDDRYTADWWQVIDSWTDEMIAHRQNMFLLNTPQLLMDGGTTIAADGTVTFNWSRFDEFINKLIAKGFTQFGGMHLMFHWNGVNPEAYAGFGRGRSGILERNGADDSLVFRGYYADDARTTNFYSQYFKALAEHLDTIYVDQANNVTVLDRWQQHVFDEPKYATSGGNDWKILAQLVKQHGVVRDGNGQVIKTMKTSDADASGILKNNASLVDRWVPDLRDYANDKAYYDNLIANGKDVAFYVCVSPPAPYLNRFTTQENITGLLLSWYAQNNKISSILHWGFNTWGYSQKTTPGDAQIVYPDKDRLGLKKSLRFEAMRDGIEDYEILEIVKGINANKADLLVDHMITSANTYSTDIQRYRSTRNLALRIASGETGVLVPGETPGGTTTINNTDNSIVYSGTWGGDGNRNFGDYNNDASYTTELNAYAELAFTGTGIAFLTEKYSDMGSYEIFVDGVSEGTFTSYKAGSREAQVVVFEKTGLTNGNHTIRVVNKSAGKYLLVDAFRVTQ